MKHETKISGVANEHRADTRRCSAGEASAGGKGDSGRPRESRAGGRSSEIKALLADAVFRSACTIQYSGTRSRRPRASIEDPADETGEKKNPEAAPKQEEGKAGPGRVQAY